ncbi:MAG: tyrosine--tRNA ligase [Thermodesulfobacteriota bacterium]|nr:tyrosine--tRNA ligase [Thermodesulfobacteriota bacterium]
MKNILEIFEERGFIEQVTDRNLVHELLEKPITCYIGFDPTASSLHLGSLVPIMALAHMQRAGHRPIALVGAGTALVGDPSGKTEMRPIMSIEEINKNAEGIKKQLARFIDFSHGKALMLNNTDWLIDLNYIDFLRDIGRHFSVNKMLSAESYRSRLKTGLNFIEFNYMLLQAYDFWHLFKHYDCYLQMGGNDQWGNILAGADLTRRLGGDTIHGLTFPLITTSAGIKMGKTHRGALWLDAGLTSPYNYYQYWINQDDKDVEHFLSLFTFLPMDEVRRLGSLKGEDIRQAKEVLAYEATKLCHGKQEADRAKMASRLLFGGDKSKVSDSVPRYDMISGELDKGISAYLLFQEAGLCKTRSEARRLISQGGGYINDKRIESFDQIIDSNDIINDHILLKAGKKRYLRVTVK